jgi:RecA-family ATPase
MGIGKSSFVMTAAIKWSIGQSLFGLVPVKPLKCLVIQAENDAGDLAIPFQDITEDINLFPDHKDTLRRNLVFKRMSTRTGEDFIAYARQQIDKYQPDIVIADPLLSYVGANVNAQVDMSKFLRNQLQPVLDETGVIWVFIHHTGKPPKEDNGKTNREAAGLSMTVWARSSWATGLGKLSPLGCWTGKAGRSNWSLVSEQAKRIFWMSQAIDCTAYSLSIDR